MRKFVYIKKSALKSIIQTELLLLVKLILQYPPLWRKFERSGNLCL